MGDAVDFVALWDAEIIHLFNRYATSWRLFDLFVTKFLTLHSVKAFPIVACLVWVWFDENCGQKRRLHIAQALAAGFLAIVISRLVQNSMNFHPRPLHTPGLDFVAPYGVPADIAHNWSSFPSDHAALVFALTMGIWQASRRLGIASLLWSIFVVCLPRIYSGFHFPSDIVSGAVIGVISFGLVVFAFRKIEWSLFDLRKYIRYGPLFYTAAFFVLFEMVTMFDDVRIASSGLLGSLAD